MKNRILLCLSVLISLASCSSEKEPEIDRQKALLGRGYGVNNIALVVENYDSVQKHYQEVLGFSIRNAEKPKADRYSGSYSSTASFADMGVLTLMGYSDSLPAASRKVPDLLYSISTSNIDSTNSWLTSQGFTTDSVNTFYIPSPPQRENSWTDSITPVLRTSIIGEQAKRYHPVFEEQSDFPYSRMEEWDSFYIFFREFNKHPNGVVGVAALEVGVTDLEEARQGFSDMGFTEIVDSTLTDGARFLLRDRQEIRLLPQEKEGLAAVVFDVIQLDSTQRFLESKLPEGALKRAGGILEVSSEHAFGLQLKFKQEPLEQAEMVAKVQLNFGGKLDSTARANAAAMYAKYCALCHGDNREGYAADHAPSLKSTSLLSTSQGTNFMRYTIQYGRANTAMAGYYDAQGGPMSYIEIELLLKWLYEEAGVEEANRLSRDAVEGDAALGSTVYAQKCAVCHGAEGEGVTAPALGNPMLLATATDEFLRYAIQEGRDGTPMIGFKDSLSAEEINGVTAFLRSRASGWNVPEGDTIRIPSPEEYVLNPMSPSPQFDLKDGLFLSAKQLNQAMKDSLQLVILDARSEVAWKQMHIPGAIPVPYYEDPEEVLKEVSKDSTWVVAYCACPHAASGRVVTKLRKLGYKKTAIMDEGILVWAQQGYPVRHGN